MNNEWTGKDAGSIAEEMFLKTGNWFWPRVIMAAQDKNFAKVQQYLRNYFPQCYPTMFSAEIY